mgnify:CR=1 FL=1
MGADNRKTSGTEKVYNNLEIKLYARRWFQLILLMLFLSTVSMKWMTFASITNIVARYYNVSRTLVEYTSIMCMVARVFLLFPALFLIDKLVSQFSIYCPLYTTPAAFYSNFLSWKIFQVLYYKYEVAQYLSSIRRFYGRGNQEITFLSHRREGGGGNVMKKSPGLSGNRIYHLLLSCRVR